MTAVTFPTGESTRVRMTRERAVPSADGIHTTVYLVDREYEIDRHLAAIFESEGSAKLLTMKVGRGRPPQSRPIGRRPKKKK